MSPFPRKKAPQKPRNANQRNNVWRSPRKDFIVMQKTDAETEKLADLKHPHMELQYTGQHPASTALRAVCQYVTAY